MSCRDRGRPAAMLLAVALTVSACGGDGDDRGDGDGGGGGLGSGATAATGTGTSTGPALADLALTLTPVAEADSPTSLVTRPGTGALYVAERGGRVRPLAVGGTGAERTYDLGDPVLDIREDVVADVERGLLDIAFSPDGTALYVSYSLAPGGDTRVDGYRMAGDTVDAASRREILAVDQPAANHNGGDVEFGPDGYLYVGLGDGGGAGDPLDTGQDPSDLLGSLLRIDPSAPAGGRPYGIPAGNPFAAGGGDGDGAPEVWLYGVRNPWRFTFDPATGDLWVADVGQAEWEEVDLLPAPPADDDAGGTAADDGAGGDDTGAGAEGTAGARAGAGAGANLGWSGMEGSHPYEGGEEPDGAVPPVFEYSHEEGCSITGGPVYRGEGVPGLAGAYLFTDYCQGVLRALRVEDGEVVDAHAFTDATLAEPVSFGVDATGDAYVLSLGGTIARIDAAG